MDQLELAERQYRELVPRELLEKSKADRDLTMGHLQAAAWVNNYVVPAVEELWDRPRFQEMATWPLRVWAGDSESVQRKQLQQTEDALVAAAKALLKLADYPPIAKHAQAANPAKPRITRESVQIAGDPPDVRVIEKHTELIEDLPTFRQQTSFIAGRGWEDLVCTEDYFHPVGNVLGNAATVVSPTGSQSRRGKLEQSHQPKRRVDTAVTMPVDAALLLFLNRDLVPIVDFISRAMMARIDKFILCLRQYRATVFRAAAAAGCTTLAGMKSETAAWTHLSEQRDALYLLCLSGKEQILRDSAIGLCQVYLAFRSKPDIEWLPLSRAAIRSGAARLRYYVEKRRDLATLERIAAALGSMRGLYQDYPPEQSAFEEALASGGLVLIESPPEMHWEKNLLRIDWSRNRASWEFWVALAKKSKRGLLLTADDLDPEGRRRKGGAIYSRKNRADELVRLEAPTLAHAISSGQTPKTYRLDLDRSRIHVLPRRVSASAPVTP